MNILNYINSFGENSYFIYIDKDLTIDCKSTNDNYNLYYILNKYKLLIFDNDKIMDKLLFLLPLFKERSILLKDVTEELLLKIVSEKKEEKVIKKFKTATCTIIKDEHQYLEEWINHNISLGFDEIWLFEDYKSKSHKDITDKYPQVHLNRLYSIKNSFKKNRSKQCWLYNYFLRKYNQRFDWVAFIDIDEFIMFEEGWNLQKLINEYQNEGGVYLFWKMFNANGLIDNPKASVVETFKTTCDTLKQDGIKWVYKTLCNLKYPNQQFLGNHEAMFGISTNGLHSRDYRCFDKVCLNHYFTRSWEEWCDRFIKRGDIADKNRKINQFFECNPDMLPMRHKLMEKYEEYKLNYENTIKKEE